MASGSPQKPKFVMVNGQSNYLISDIGNRQLFYYKGSEQGVMPQFIQVESILNKKGQPFPQQDVIVKQSDTKNHRLVESRNSNDSNTYQFNQSIFRKPFTDSNKKPELNMLA